MTNGLYNYISQSPRLFGYIIFIVLSAALGYVFRYYADIFSDQNLSFYLFSTIVQGFVALVGFLGAVVIFKLQLLENEASAITDGVRPSMNDYKGSIAYTYSSKEMMNEVEKVIHAGGNPMHGQQLLFVYNKLKKIFDEHGVIRSQMVDFSIWSFGDVSLALIGLPISKLLVFYKLYLFLTIYSIVNIGLSIAALYIAFSLIRKILGYSFKISL